MNTNENNSQAFFFTSDVASNHPLVKEMEKSIADMIDRQVIEKATVNYFSESTDLVMHGDPDFLQIQIGKIFLGLPTVKKVSSKAVLESLMRYVPNLKEENVYEMEVRQSGPTFLRPASIYLVVFDEVEMDGIQVLCKNPELGKKVVVANKFPRIDKYFDQLLEKVISSSVEYSWPQSPVDSVQGIFAIPKIHEGKEKIGVFCVSVFPGRATVADSCSSSVNVGRPCVHAVKGSKDKIIKVMAESTNQKPFFGKVTVVGPDNKVIDKAKVKNSSILITEFVAPPGSTVVAEIKEGEVNFITIQLSGKFNYNVNHLDVPEKLNSILDFIFRDQPDENDAMDVSIVDETGFVLKTVNIVFKCYTTNVKPN